MWPIKFIVQRLNKQHLVKWSFGRIGARRKMQINCQATSKVANFHCHIEARISIPN